MATVQYSDLVDAVYSVGGFYLSEDSIYVDYSGRGMYGDQCLGLVYDSENDLDDFIEALAERGVRLRGRRGDSMGMSAIAYWPGVTVEGAPDDDDE